MNEKKLACIVFETKNPSEVTQLEKILEAYFPDHSVRSIGELGEKLSWEYDFKAIFSKLGITSSSKGYKTLKCIIGALADDPNKREHIFLKELYAVVTEYDGASYSMVERRIRTVVDYIYNNNSPEYVNSILQIPNGYNKRIKNAYFISKLSEVIFG